MMKRVLCAVCVCLVVGVWGYWLVVGVLGVQFFMPGTGTMEPSIFGPSVAGGVGDIVVLRTRFSVKHLRRGDLVWAQVNYRGQEIDMIRRVAACPGDVWPNIGEVRSPGTIPEGKYMLAADATNGVDSRQLGAIDLSQVKGKVAFVVPTGKLVRPLTSGTKL